MSVALTYQKGSPLLQRYLEMNHYKFIQVYPSDKSWDVMLMIDGSVGNYDERFKLKRDAVAHAQKLSQHTGLPFYYGPHKPGEKTMKKNPRNSEPDEHAVRELDIYADNSRELQPQRDAIIKNLLLKIRKGKYDHAKAPKLWEYWYESAAKLYAKEFASTADWSKIFSPATRREAAHHRADEMYRDMKEGQFDYLLAGKNPMKKKRKSTKKPSAKQLAARKRFAAAARAGTLRKGRKLSKAAPRKKVIKKVAKRRSVRVLTRNPAHNEFRVVCEKNKKRYYYTGSTWLTNKAKAKLFASKRAATVVGSAFARKYPGFSFGVLTN